jgi:isopenicillin N synthase-like dioxygenase
LLQRTHNNSRGYYEEERTKQTLDWKKGFDFGNPELAHPDLPADHPDNVVLDGFNQWPAGMLAFKSVAVRYYSALAELSARLMTAVAASLGQPAERFAAEFSPHTSFLRLNYYPVCPNPAEHLAVNRHTDAGALTVLLQQDGVTALQVNHRGSGEWRDIEPVSGAFTVNVGDMLQVLACAIPLLAFLLRR